MIIQEISPSIGPGMWGLFYCSFLWVLGILITLLHRSGLQVVGGVIACIGIVSLLFQVQIVLALTLLTFGFFMHGCGRILMHLRRRG